MATTNMTSRFPPEQVVSRIPLALALLCAVAGCDGASDDDAFTLRSIDASDQPVDPAASDDIKGAPNINCPQCGNQWTISERGEMAIFLTRDFGDQIAPLVDSESARVFSEKKDGKIFFDVEPDEHGYTFLVYDNDAYEGASLAPEHRKEFVVVRFVHDTAEVDLRLPYVDNQDCVLGPPDL